MSEIRETIIPNSKRRRWGFTEVRSDTNDRYELEVDEDPGGIINIWAEEGDIGGRGAERHAAGVSLSFEDSRALVEFLHPILYGEDPGESVRELLHDAVQTDGDHHKQWYLEQIAERLGISLPSLEERDEGIAP